MPNRDAGGGMQKVHKGHLLGGNHMKKGGYFIAKMFESWHLTHMVFA